MKSTLDFSKIKWGVIDLETSGVQPEVDQIIEMGVLLFEGTQLLKKIDVLIHPINPKISLLNSEIVLLTGITDDELEQKGIEGKWDEWGELLNNAILLAHNASFEQSFLKNHFASYNVTFLDSITFLTLLFPWRSSFSLEAFIRDFKVAQSEEHRAYSDALNLLEFLLFAVSWHRKLNLDHAKFCTSLASLHAPFFNSWFQLFYALPENDLESISQQVNFDLHERLNNYAQSLENPFMTLLLRLISETKDQKKIFSSVELLKDLNQMTTDQETARSGTFLKVQEFAIKVAQMISKGISGLIAKNNDGNDAQIVAIFAYVAHRYRHQTAIQGNQFSTIKNGKKFYIQFLYSKEIPDFSLQFLDQFNILTLNHFRLKAWKEYFDSVLKSCDCGEYEEYIKMYRAELLNCAISSMSGLQVISSYISGVSKRWHPGISTLVDLLEEIAIFEWRNAGEIHDGVFMGSRLELLMLKKQQSVEHVRFSLAAEQDEFPEKERFVFLSFNKLWKFFDLFKNVDRVDLVLLEKVRKLSEEIIEFLNKKIFQFAGFNDSFSLEEIKRKNAGGLEKFYELYQALIDFNKELQHGLLYDGKGTPQDLDNSNNRDELDSWQSIFIKSFQEHFVLNDKTLQRMMSNADKFYLKIAKKYEWGVELFIEPEESSLYQQNILLLNKLSCWRIQKEQNYWDIASQLSLIPKEKRFQNIQLWEDESKKKLNDPTLIPLMLNVASADYDLIVDLLKRNKNILCLLKDASLCAMLYQKLKNNNNFSSYEVNLSSHFIRSLEKKNKPDRIICIKRVRRDVLAELSELEQSIKWDVCIVDKIPDISWAFIDQFIWKKRIDMLHESASKFYWQRRTLLLKEQLIGLLPMMSQNIVSQTTVSEISSGMELAHTPFLILDPKLKTWKNSTLEMVQEALAQHFIVKNC